jgi:predicted adenine nucleotide alpha hydrolase (AANH) superfamily ATPase
MAYNYHKRMMDEIKSLAEGREHPRLLLHSCCAPCSSYVLSILKDAFALELFFFNPNIYPEQEYAKRLEEQIRLVKEMGLNYKVIGTEQDSHLFYEAVKGCEGLGEGSQRCMACFELRLDRTAHYAKSKGFDCFTTTLTISPKKNAEAINKIGLEMGEKNHIKFLVSDFKKNNGYKSSIDLSKKYQLYRQDYCGCIFSKQERGI